jgi:hypothetical protein
MSPVDERDRLMRRIEELELEKTFEKQFADKLKEFGTIDRLIEEYSAAKMKSRKAEERLGLAEAALRKARDHTPAIPGPFMTIRDIIMNYFASSPRNNE